VNPHDEEQKILARERQIGRNHPELIKHPEIANFQSVDRLSDRDGGGVGNEQEWNGQPQRKLPSLAGGDAKVAPAIEGVQSQGAMDEE